MISRKLLFALFLLPIFVFMTISPAGAAFAYVSFTETQIDVSVGSTFLVHVSIHSLPLSMTGFDFVVDYDPTQIQFNPPPSGYYFPTGWTKTVYDYSTLGKIELAIHADDDLAAISYDHEWLVASFTCLAAGTSIIEVSPSLSQDTIILVDGSVIFYPAVNIPCNQHVPPPEGPNLHVGGELFTANKLAVLSPYLALISVVAVAAVVVKCRRT